MKHTTRRAGAKAPLKRLTTGLRVFPEAFRPGQLARVAVLPGGLRCQLRFVTQLFRMKGKLEEKDIDATAAGLRLFTPKGEEEELGRGVGKMWRADTSAPATALLFRLFRLTARLTLGYHLHRPEAPRHWYGPTS